MKTEAQVRVMQVPGPRNVSSETKMSSLQTERKQENRFSPRASRRYTALLISF